MNDNTPTSEDSTKSTTLVDETKSLENVGLEFDSSVPDPLRYSGANFINLADIVPETAWKSTNKNDVFKFDANRNFDGSLSLKSDGSFSISSKANASSDSSLVELVSRKIKYHVKIKFGALTPGTDIPASVASLRFQVNINVKGSGTSYFGTFEKETGASDTVEIAAPDGFVAEPIFSFSTKEDLDDVGKITEATLRLNALQPILIETLSGFKVESIEIAKQNLSGTIGSFAKIEVDKEFTDGGEYQGTVSDPMEEEFVGSSFESDLFPAPDTTGLSDEFGFYQKTYASSNFELSLKVTDIINKENSVDILPPTFGLLARSEPSTRSSSAKALADSFCLFVETNQLTGRSSERSHAVYISVNGEAKKHKTEITSITTRDELKITKEKGIFKGYYNDILIGSEPFKSEIDDFNEKVAAGEKKKVNSFQLGVAYFAPPTVKYGEEKSILLSSEAIFSEPPVIILKDRYFSVVEIYNLSLFYGRYGLGRTINTFTLLPGESTEIEITSSRTSSQGDTKKTNVFEKVDSSSKSELEKSIESENSRSSTDASSQSASASVTAGYSGWGASVSATVSGSTSKSSSRSDMARSVAGAVSNEASEYSSERSIEANTTTTSAVEDNSTNTLKRKLENLNNNRTLNFVFRQLNQEFISILHLVDIRIGFFGADDTYGDVGIDGLKSFIERFVSEEEVGNVYNRMIKDIRFVDDYNDNRVDVLLKKDAPDFDKPFQTVKLDVTDEEKKEDEGTANTNQKIVETRNDFGATDAESIITFSKRLTQDFPIADGIKPIEDIKGVIIRADRYVVKTDGVATEAIVGEGDALDEYGISLQDEDIREKQANTRIQEAKGDLLLLQKDIMNATDNECVRIKYLKYFNFLESKSEGSAARGDFDDLPWYWLKNAWASSSFKLGVALCFLVLISLSFSYRIAFLSRL